MSNVPDDRAASQAKLIWVASEPERGQCSTLSSSRSLQTVRIANTGQQQGRPHQQQLPGMPKENMGKLRSASAKRSSKNAMPMSTKLKVPSISKSSMPMATDPKLVAGLLRSISDLSLVGEEDDSRLLPALDAWLAGRLPYLTFSRSVDSSDAHGTTLLMVAACFGKVETVRRLISAGADVNHCNSSGRTPLTYAALGADLPRHNLAIIRALLEAGAWRGIGAALETAALLGRSSLVAALAGAGGLQSGHICLVNWPAQRAVHGCECRVLEFSSSTHAYAVTMLSGPLSACDTTAPGTLDPPEPLGKGPPMATVYEGMVKQLRRSLVEGKLMARSDADDLRTHEQMLRGTVAVDEEAADIKMAGRALLVAIPARQLRVALHLLDTERCDPVLAAGANPLDVAAGALAGAPPLLPRAHDGCTMEGVMSIRPGQAVQIIRRPEQWLRGRTGRVREWNPDSGRFVVALLPASKDELTRCRARKDGHSGMRSHLLNIRCLPQDLLKVDERLIGPGVPSDCELISVT